MLKPVDRSTLSVASHEIFEDRSEYGAYRDESSPTPSSRRTATEDQKRENMDCASHTMVETSRLSSGSYADSLDS